MAIQSVAPGSWSSITLTAGDTLFQNQSQREVYLLVGLTGGVPIRDGFLMGPWEGIIISSGKDVSCSSLDGTASIFYMEV